MECNVAILQMDIAWADAAANRARVEQLIQQAPGADLYVLPEMFSTGFGMQPEKMAEPEEGGETLRWMKGLAAAGGFALAGSLPVRAAQGRYYNRFYFVHPDGKVEAYDKHHLFAFGGEDIHYTPGRQRVVVSYKGFRILLQVCYDLRFPVWMRNRGDYDMILFVASWPVSRREVWDVLLRARALENQCYVVGVNRVGSDPSAEYDGGSVVVSPYGKVMAACGDGQEGVAVVSVSSAQLTVFRSRFPVLKDADEFSFC